jgi:hypothetical protein
LISFNRENRNLWNLNRIRNSLARKIFGKIRVDGGIPPGYKLRVLAWEEN